MNKAIVAMLLLFSAGFAMSSDSDKESPVNRICIVNVASILENAIAIQKIKLAVEDIDKKIKEKIVTQKNILKKKEDSILEERITLAKEELDTKIASLNKEIVHLQEQSYEYRTKLEYAHTKAMNKIHDEMVDIVKDIACTNSCAVVLSSSQVLYSLENLDITDQVLQKLNSSITNVELGLVVAE